MRYLIFVAISLVFSTSAFADCVGYLSPADHISKSDMVFLGKAKKTIRLDGPAGWEQGPDHETEFEIIELLKGNSDSQSVLVLHKTKEQTDYGATFTPEERYAVFANFLDDGRLATSDCLLAPWFIELKGWTWEDYRNAAKQN